MSAILTRRAFAAALGCAALTIPLSATGQGWPAKPVVMIVPWGAGGGTDATARMIATLLEKEIGKPVPVVNRTGGSGVVGHAAIASAAPDGHTIGVVKLEIGGMHHQGLTDLDHKAYAPIGLYNSDPAATFVGADSPYADIGALLEAIKASPDRALKASGSAQGGVNHLAMVGMLKASGIRRLGALERGRAGALGPGRRRGPLRDRLAAGRPRAAGSQQDQAACSTSRG